MKKFIIKSSIIFLFLLLFFRLTIVSLINSYENKIIDTFSSENVKNLKIELFNNLKNLNNKDKILHEEDARILNQFFIKIQKELNLHKE